MSDTGLFVGARARVFFSPEHKEIIRRTPHVRRKTSRLLVGCLGVLLLPILVAVIAALAGQLESGAVPPAPSSQ